MPIGPFTLDSSLLGATTIGRLAIDPNQEPVVLSLNVTSGPIAGGTAVTITGRNFTGATSAFPLTGIVIVNDTTITGTTAAVAADGPVDVVVSTPNGSGYLQHGFTYADVTAVFSITPAIGPAEGGYGVTISGILFTGATSVPMLSSFAVVNDTTITGTVASHARGTINVTVVAPGGTGTLTSAFEYIDALSTSGCVAWYDAGLGVTTISSAVSAWADQSGAGDTNRNLVQATSGNRPAFSASDAAFNNRPIIQTDGVNDQLQGGGAWASPAPYSQPLTIYAVVADVTANAAGFIFGHSSITTSRVAAGNGFMDGGTNLPLTPPAGPSVRAFVFDGASSADYENDSTTASTTGNAGANALGSFKVGTDIGASPGLFWGGKMAALLVYSGHHDATTRGRIMRDYLGKKFGIAVT